MQFLFQLMSDESFDRVLSWVVLLSGVSPLFNALICFAWLFIVRRTLSKIIFMVGFLVMVLMVVTRVMTSYDFQNQEVRIVNAVFFAVGGLMSTFILFWNYLSQRKATLERTEEEQLQTEKSFNNFTRSVITINPDKVVDYIYQLHPRDVVRLLHRYKVKS